MTTENISTNTAERSSGSGKKGLILIPVILIAILIFSIFSLLLSAGSVALLVMEMLNFKFF